MDSLPIAPGVVVVTNYRTGPYTVAEICPDGEAFSIVTTTGQYLNGYVFRDGRILKARPWLPGSSGYLSNGGGRDGDGFDEVFIVDSQGTDSASATGKRGKSSPAQLSLF